jgi:hypothetical protein
VPQVGGEPRSPDLSHALLELVLGKPPGEQMLTEETHRVLPFPIRYEKRRHVPSMVVRNRV